MDEHCTHLFRTEECIPITDGCTIATEDVINIGLGFFGFQEKVFLGNKINSCVKPVDPSLQIEKQQEPGRSKRRKWFISDRFKFEFQDPEIIAVGVHVKIGGYERYFDRAALDHIDPWVHDVGFCPSICFSSNTRELTHTNKQVSLWLYSRCRIGMFVFRPSLWIHPEKWSEDPVTRPLQTEETRSPTVETAEGRVERRRVTRKEADPMAKKISVTLFGHKCDEPSIIYNATQTRFFYVQSEEEINYIINAMIMIIIAFSIVFFCSIPIIRIPI